ILAARNARIALEHGFTTIRDLETEGAMYADVDVKHAVDRGEIPGPRIFASTRAMAPTGMSPIVTDNWELELPHGLQPVDGVEGARLAVREQVAHGADWIKFYSDRRYYFGPGPDSVLHSWVNFTDDEARAIVDEAHRLGRKVAAHAIGSDGIAAALRAGVNTIEHGDGMTDSLLDVRCEGRVLGSDGDGGLLRRRAAQRRVGTDGGAPTPGVHPGAQEGRPDRVRNRCRRISLDRAQSGERVRVLCAVWHDPDAGDQVGNVARGGAAGPTGSGRRRPWRLCGPGRGGGGPVEGCGGTVARAIRYEGRGHLSFAIVRRALETSLALLFGAVGPVVGQFTPPGTGGVAVLAGALKQLGANKRILMIGAHPDDEYSDLVALFARGMGAQVAYLSLSRGEGGQNLIGPELGPELGVIRSEELLAARRIDGARQFFTRAYDFGYSKTLDEALRLWPRDSVLKDVLDVVRRFRPQIIVSVFSGTPRDGHGQHQVAGLVARQALGALRDPTRPDAIAPLLARALRELGAADSGQQAILEEALAAAAGVVIDGFADDGIVIPGERVQVETSVWDAGDAGVTLDGIELGTPVGWKVERLDAMSSPVPRGTLATRRFAVTVAA